ncbi:N-lysine methyltransferase KMT5A isoform X2 [Alligator sinensis]|uniref:[histone H4]-lysine(20) N-methyltransferase n=1 Tax=Alligator sinensis TaxID=38654 RepID=A0A3Q0G3C8_ALLSI|nr:N-lysine methyltransferase KMT5A isoform X2 [Alligator sinensis]
MRPPSSRGRAGEIKLLESPGGLGVRFRLARVPICGGVGGGGERREGRQESRDLNAARWRHADVVAGSRESLSRARHDGEKEKRNAGNPIEGATKPEDQKDKESGCDSSASVPNQNQEAAETRKNMPLPSNSTDAAKAKQAQKKVVKAKGPRRKAQGKTSQNRKVTDYYPVRRSSRKSKTELQTEEKKRIDELITNGKEEGMKIDFIDGKGRGVIATKHFNRGEFVVEYHGDLIEITDAKKREAVYAQDPSTGCYMYYFQYLSKTYCVDATKETNRLGRLINHSKCGNCQTKLHDIDGVPHLILIASRDIKVGEELLYDYGDRSKASIEAHPWLKH